VNAWLSHFNIQGSKIINTGLKQYVHYDYVHACYKYLIAEKPTIIEKLTVGEAVMKMDLLDVPALLFVNSGNHRLNIVYYRKDGNIAWVDSSVG